MISKKTILAALAASLLAGPAMASHNNGFCVRAGAIPSFVAAGLTSRQTVLQGENGLVVGFGPPGYLAVLWDKTFDVNGKERALNVKVVQGNALPTQLEMVECARHTMEGYEVSPWQGLIRDELR